MREHAGSLPGTYLEADLRTPREILDRAPLDFGEPIGLMLAAVLHFVRDDEDPQGIVGTLAGALPSGSYVVVSHATWEYLPPAAVTRLTAHNGDGRFTPRDGSRFAAFFEGLTPVDPGLVSVARWHADGEDQPRPSTEDVACNGLVARVP